MTVRFVPVFRSYFIREDIGSPDIHSATSGGVDFVVRVPLNEVWLLENLRLVIIDQDMDPIEFAGTNLPLTNGIQIDLLSAEDESIFDFTVGRRIKSNRDLIGQFGRLLASTNYGASTQDLLMVEWQGLDNAGSGLLVDGTAGEYLRIRINDPMNGITSFQALANGQIIQRGDVFT